MNRAGAPTGRSPRAESGAHVTPALVHADWRDQIPAGTVVAVAMSGGVDSSVAAARVAATGIPALGITLRMWPRDGAGPDTSAVEGGCCSVDAADDARRVCAQVGIPHYVWDLEEEFTRTVVRDYEEELRQARTPNPCVRCNERIKFGELMRRARAVGATHVATGHHARLGRRGAAVTLHRALDRVKDQSYALHRLGQQRLGAALLPLADLPDKAAVRAEATTLGLATAGRPDSQDLCFVGPDRREDVERRLGADVSAGPVVDADGQRVGTHRGLAHLTIGQRTGLSIEPARPDAAPLFVLRLDPGRNAAVVGPRDALLVHHLRLTSWVSSSHPPRPGEELLAQTRARGAIAEAVVESVAGALVNVRIPGGVHAVAPGQSAVLYRADEVVGGGVVDSTA